MQQKKTKIIDLKIIRDSTGILNGKPAMEE